MQASVWRALEQALTILKLGSVQPTETFLFLMPRRTTDNEWSQRMRTVHMLAFLTKILDITDSRWKLVQLAGKGQSGLYQLKKRDLFDLPPTNNVMHERSAASES